MRYKYFLIIIIITLQSRLTSKENSLTILKLSSENYIQPTKMWGVDLLISNGGFGVGGFYGLKMTSDYTFTTSLTISEAKDESEVEYYDYWGQVYTPGKINRFLVIPFYTGVQKRLFSDDIIDNFRPYVNAAVGPTLIFTTDYNTEFFSSLKKGLSHWTFGGYIGIGANFGSAISNFTGINIRYYFIPYKSGIPSMLLSENKISTLKEFGGFFITLNFGKGY